MLIKMETNSLLGLPNILLSELYKSYYCRGSSRHLDLSYWLILFTKIATTPAHDQSFRSSNSAACLENRNFC